MGGGDASERWAAAAGIVLDVGGEVYSGLNRWERLDDGPGCWLWGGES